MGGNRSSFLFHFRPIFLFYTPCKRQKLRSSIVSRGYKIGILFMLIFTKFKSSFFWGAIFSNCLWILKWIARESLLHRVIGVHKQADIVVQINTLQTQGVKITLIQRCFNIATLKQCRTNVISIPCVYRVIVWKNTRKTFTTRCKGAI